LLRFLPASGLLASPAANWLSLVEVRFPLNIVDICTLCRRRRSYRLNKMGDVAWLFDCSRIWRVRGRANITHERFGRTTRANWSNGETNHWQLVRPLLHQVV
jgi:hypothetical protein